MLAKYMTNVHDLTTSEFTLFMVHTLLTGHSIVRVNCNLPETSHEVLIILPQLEILELNS